MSDFVKIEKKWIDRFPFKAQPFTNFIAYTFLIEACSFRYTDKIGQISASDELGVAVFSHKFLRARFLWTPTRLAKFLVELNGELDFDIQPNDEVVRFKLNRIEHYCDAPSYDVEVVELPLFYPAPPPERRSIKTSDRATVLKRGQCKYCGATDADFHVDHRVPFSRGGSNYLSNLECACASCNLSKGAKTLREWTQK